MNDILKATKFDFYLVRPYFKSLWASFVLPIAIAVIYKSVIFGISLAVCMNAMFIGYPFSISEKNGMEKLYGILPISKKHLVFGRYLFTCSMCLVVLLFSCIVHPIILSVIGVPVQLPEIALAVLLGIVIFSFYTVFQLPGFYKYGSLKGKAFMYIPILFYLAVILIFAKFNTAVESLLSFVINNPLVAVATVALVFILAYWISINASIRALQNKEV